MTRRTRPIVSFTPQAASYLMRAYDKHKGKYEVNFVLDETVAKRITQQGWANSKRGGKGRELHAGEG